MSITPEDIRKYELSLLDNLLEGCQIIGFDWMYLYLNDAAIAHARKPRMDLLGKTMMECYPGIEATPVFDSLRGVMNDRMPRRVQNEFTYPDGRKGWFELHIQPCIEGILILTQDITDSKMALETAAAELRRLETLRRIDRAIVSTTDPDLLGDLVLDLVTASLEVDAAMILLFNPNTLRLEKMRTRGFRGTSDSDDGLRLGDGISGRTALERKTVALPDLAAAEAFTRQAMAAREGFKSYFGAPLVAKGELIGVLEIYHRQAGPRPADWMNFLEILAGQLAIAIDHQHTFGQLQSANLNLMLAYDNTIEGWAKTLELRDFETEGHCKRVTILTDEVAALLNYSASDRLHLRRGAMLHDIGKIGIPDAILFKPGPLDDAEWEMMRRHPTLARDLLAKIDFLAPALDIPYCHHEKWDGSGYPRGLEGDAIPEPARIFALVDVWDALNSDRPYRQKWGKDQITAYYLDQSGTHFEPRLVDVFLKHVNARK
ncbi:MAG: HD domain-containing protein [Anaerolineae bacterium]|nr:MAG: HD domain-containing protein [Anaerolineae bacterium]